MGVVISVILPSYNHAKFVFDSVSSALSQTFRDIEIIVIDDNSNDESLLVLGEMKDFRMQVIPSDKNRGQYYCINEGIKRARGEYIAILNSDDYWHPEKLEKQIAYLESHPSCGAVFTRVNVVNEQGFPFCETNHFYYSVFEKEKNRNREEWLNKFFYGNNCLCHPSVLIRRKCHEEIGLYQENFFALADLDLWVRLCFKYEIHILDEKLTYFRIRDNEANGSGNHPGNRRRIFFEHFQLLDLYPENIRSVSILSKIFPELKIPFNEDKFIPYYLAMLVNKPQFYGTEYYFWALHVLFNSMKNHSLVEEMEQKLNFTYSDFIRMTGLHLLKKQKLFRMKVLPDTFLSIYYDLYVKNNVF